MSSHTTADDDAGQFRRAADEETGTFVVPSTTRRSPFAQVADLFTQPLAGHLSMYRAPARTVLLAVTLVMSIGVLVTPAGAPYRTLPVLGTLVALVGLVAASLVPPLHRILDRLTGLVVVVGAHLLVAGTGGASSALRPVYLLALVYFAAFYTTRRLVTLGTLAGVSLVLTEIGPHAGDAATTSVDMATDLVAWVTVVVTIHVLVQRLRTSAHTDPLTGLANHGAFWDAVTLEHARAERDDTCYSVLLVDLDHFKAINDSHGHQVGDEILKQVGELLQRRTRRVDIAARYGGEEFAVVLSATGSVGARIAGEKVRSRVARMASRVDVTASVGVATYRAGDELDPASVVRAADEALYRAKRNGRDRVEIAPMPRPVGHR